MRRLALPTGSLLALLFTCGTTPGQNGPPGGKGRDEEQLVRKIAERSVKGGDTERDRWLKELSRAYPGRVSPGLSDADLDQWFDLASGGRPEWRREESPSKGVAELFDRAAERLNLQKPSALRRDEFRAYARGYLGPDNSPPWKSADPLAAADKSFRALDADRDGLLQPAEWSDGLRAVATRADANRDGVIDPAEYRAYFAARVAWTAQSIPPPPEKNAPKPPEPPRPGPTPPGNAPRPPAGRPGPPAPLPGWFRELDTDGDGQVGLYEWRRAGRSIKDFVPMDLNGDGYLTPAEYRRYLQREQDKPQSELTGPAPRGSGGKRGPGKRAGGR